MIGVLFDLDGVLVDSETIYTQFWEDIEKTYPTGIDNFAYKIKGSNLSKILNTYFSDKKVQKEIVALIDKFEKKMIYKIFPDVIPFLNELYSMNISCAIVTSSSSTKMERLFNQHPYFKNYFKAIVTGDMVTHSKPHPECFLEGAKRINCMPNDCFVFEDSISGIEAGESANCNVIALATTLKRDDINKKANKIIDNFEGFSVKSMLSI